VIRNIQGGIDMLKDGIALGAVGGAIGGNAGKGAAIGAAVGGLGSVMRQNRRAREAYYGPGG